MLLRTPTGTILVENVPEGVEGLVDGQKITLKRDGDEVTIEAVPKGEHQLKLTRDGKVIWTNDVTIEFAGHQVPVRYSPGFAELAAKDDSGAGITSIKPPAPLPTSDLDRIATGKWIRLVDSKTVLSDPQKMKFQNGILELDNTTMEFPKINARDVILRRVRKVSGDNVSLGLRCGATGRLVSWFNGSADGADHFGVGKVDGGNYKGLADAHIGRKIGPNEFVEMAFAAIGGTLTLYVDGTKAVTVKNNDVADGFVRISALKGRSLFKDVECQILDRVGHTDDPGRDGGEAGARMSFRPRRQPKRSCCQANAA